ncbi:MAG: hypothetical protein J2P57_14660 [Acidimicrobiaceae bacterium]|nr:hypothetical protein [Acidimicrobiaceae bacterium]
MRPESALPEFIAANAAPYFAWALVLMLRRHGLARRWALAGGAVLYALLLVLWPVGNVELAGVWLLLYALGFIVLGTLTWIALPLLWVTWLAWSGRILNQLPREAELTNPSQALRWGREVAPLLFFTLAWLVGAPPWLWPLSSIPVIGPYMWIPFGVFFLGLIALITAMHIAGRRPHFLLPADLRNEQSPRGVGDEWPFGFSVAVATIMTVLATGIALLLGYASQLPVLTLKVLSVPLALVICFGLMGVAARYRRYRSARWRRP